MIDELRGWVGDQLSPIAKPDEIRLTDNLPKTRSGKIMRRLLRAMARGEEITQDMSTLENPAIIDQLRGMDSGPAAQVKKAPKKAAKKAAKTASTRRVEKAAKRKAARAKRAAKPAKRQAAARKTAVRKDRFATQPAKPAKSAKSAKFAKFAKRAKRAKPKARPARRKK